MIPSPLQRNQLCYALRINGYHNECEVEGGWIAADATFAPGRCFLAYRHVGGNAVIAATSLPHVGRAFAEEGGHATNDVPLPTGAVAAFSTNLDGLHATVCRLFELSRSLPSAPLDRFREKMRSLPSATEAERLVVQRIGQDVFRDALIDFWSGRCAVTGLDQPELLRASHMKPWADCATDAERLDPHNGLLLAANWDAAFDRGLVTFEEDGTALLSHHLTASARQLLVSDKRSMPRIYLLRPEHVPFLQFHRERIWRSPIQCRPQQTTL
jgi:hypothetical protein